MKIYFSLYKTLKPLLRNLKCGRGAGYFLLYFTSQPPSPPPATTLQLKNKDRGCVLVLALKSLSQTTETDANRSAVSCGVF